MISKQDAFDFGFQSAIIKGEKARGDYMTKIAVLSDIHGNTRALEAVLADAEKAGAEEYWLLGDILMPGTGRKTFSRRLERFANYGSSFGGIGKRVCGELLIEN